MSDPANSVNPLMCPLCQQPNHCMNLGAADTDKTCWCNDPDIQFPQALLEKVPKDKKGKACICKQCAQAFSINEGVNEFNPSESK